VFTVRFHGSRGAEKVIYQGESESDAQHAFERTYAAAHQGVVTLHRAVRSGALLMKRAEVVAVPRARPRKKPVLMVPQGRIPAAADLRDPKKDNGES
jgi:hypothetical protein